MKFFITAKANTTVSMRIQPICSVIEQAVIALFSDKNYGIGVTKWTPIFFCDSLDFYSTTFLQEINRYTKQGSEIETCYWIDSEDILHIDEKEIYRRICEFLLHTSMSKIKDFDFFAFHNDLITLFRQKGWLYMTFFMTSEMSVTIGNKLKFGRNSIEEKMRSLIGIKDYGIDINHWGHIVICCSPKLYEAGFFKEIKKYRKKDKELELRLRIDYEKMLKADEKEVNRLTCESILRGVDIAESEFKIKDFNFALFRQDLLSFFQKEGWI